MDFAHPLRVIAPTLDGDVLTVLAGAKDEFSGRRLHGLVGHGSEAGIRKAAERLVNQGIVLRSQAGQAKLYRLNRQHVCAEGIEQIAAARSNLLTRLRADFRTWQVQPRAAALFGSAARGEASPGSDIDVLVIRPAAVEEDSATWRRQLNRLERSATAWTGNDARLVELGEGELPQARALLEEALGDGIELAGSLSAIRHALGGDE